MHRVVQTVSLVVCLAVAAFAQQAAAPRFDVVSIKRNASGSTGSSLRPEPNGITGTNVNALRLFRVAYQLANFQVVDAPDWFEAERFDVTARAGRTVTIVELQELIKTMLADRFGVATSHETREVRGYEIQLDRPGTSRLRETPRPCATARGDQPRAVNTGVAACFQQTEGEVIARGVTLPMTAQQLIGLVGQPVVDRTGLAGLYDYELRFRPDATASSASPDGDAPSLFTAVREQLGLRLVAAKPTIDVYVITAAARPEEN
jgi:uncharacterized protein (TIGR03435 family)